MRIALISDIHANLPALEEVLLAIKNQKVDAVFSLGDIVNQNVWNNEVVEMLRKYNIKSVLGNHDKGIGEGKKFFSYAYSNAESKDWGKEAIQFTLTQINKEHQEYLRKLPQILRLQITGKHHTNLSIMLTHGTPQNINEKMYHFLPKQNFINLLQQIDTDILVVGNTHVPHHQTFTIKKNKTNCVKHIINPGSVGKPKDGDWRASYVIINITNQYCTSKLFDIQVNFYRIKYNLDKAVKAIKKSNLPLYYASGLITGL